MNFTTPGGICADNECFVNPSDYAWLKHRSVVAFSRAEIGNASKLEQCINFGHLQQLQPNIVPAVTIDFIVARAKISKELSPEKKLFLN